MILEIEKGDIDLFFHSDPCPHIFASSNNTDIRCEIELPLKDAIEFRIRSLTNTHNEREGFCYGHKKSELNEMQKCIDLLINLKKLMIKDIEIQEGRKS